MRGPRRASARVAQAVPSPHGPSRAGHEGGGNERGPWARPPQGERERQPEMSGYPATSDSTESSFAGTSRSWAARCLAASAAWTSTRAPTQPWRARCASLAICAAPARSSDVAAGTSDLGAVACPRARVSAPSWSEFRSVGMQAMRTSSAAARSTCLIGPAVYPQRWPRARRPSAGCCSGPTQVSRRAQRCRFALRASGIGARVSVRVDRRCLGEERACRLGEPDVKSRSPPRVSVSRS